MQMPGRRRAGGPPLAHFAENLLDNLFYYNTGTGSGFVRAAWMVVLLLFGVLMWGVFFRWGNIAFDFLDWAEVTGPRYALLQDAVRQGVLPLHAANTTALRGVTDRYFSIADTPFSPQIVLLGFLEIGRYIFIDTLIIYALGFAGLVLIARKYRIAPLPFLVMFLLFNFNGFITAHFAVGHSIWTGYFLIPYFVYLVMELLEREQAGWRWILGLSILLLVILLQGFFHLYLWCLLFLGVLALINFRLIKPVVLGGLFSVLFALPRLLPPSLVLSGITHNFLGGFATVTELIFNMFMMRDPDRAMELPSNILPLRWWEQDFFIGLLGFAVLVLFGIIFPLARDRSRKSVQVQLLLACLIFAALSVGQVYGWIIRILPVPPLTAERVTTRMFGLPLVFLIVLAAIFFQRWLEEKCAIQTGLPAWIRVLLLGLTVLLFHDLYQHLRAWRVRYLDGLVYLFPKIPFDAAQHSIANYPDPIYTGMLLGGLAVSVLSFVFLLVMVRRERKTVNR